MRSLRLAFVTGIFILFGSMMYAQQTADHTLTLYIPQSVSENDGVLQDRGWIRIPYPAEQDHRIDLASDDSTEVQVPSFVYVREGDATVYFDVTIVDDNSIDGRQQATITATSSLWDVSTGHEVYIDDNETDNTRRERFIGDVETFKVKNFRDNSYYETDGYLAAKGKYCYFWIEQDRVLSDEAFAQMVYQFDYIIYPTVRANFGSEVTPGIDNELKIHIFLLDIKDDYDSSESGSRYVKSHYDPIDEFSTHFYTNSNEKELLFIDVNEQIPLSTEFYRSLCYQMTRMIIYNKDTYEHQNEPGQEEVWVQDGLANLSCFLTGYGHPTEEVSAFLKKTNTRLVETNSKYYTVENVGLSYLFFLYLYEQYGGKDFTRQITEIPQNGVNGINTYLNGYPLDFNSLLEYLYSAIIIDDVEAGAVFHFENIDLAEPVYFSEHLLYPVREKKGQVEWTGVRYIAFKGFHDNKFYLNLRDLTNSRTIRARMLLKAGKKKSWQEVINFDYSGYSTFIKQHIGEDYEYLVLMLTNIGEFSDGDYEYDARISGPLIVPFFNPVFPDELFINIVSSSEPEIKIEQEGWDGFKYLVLNEFKPYHFTANYHIDKDFVGTGEVTAIGSSPEGEFGEVHWFFNVKRFLPYWDPYDSGNWQILSRLPERKTGKYAIFNKKDSEAKMVDSITLHTFGDSGTAGEFKLVYFPEGDESKEIDKYRIVKKYGDYTKVIKQKSMAGKITSSVIPGGEYFVMYDARAPFISEFDLIENEGMLEVEAVDDDSGVKGVVVKGVSEFEKTVDGNRIMLRIPVEGSGKIEIEVEDQFGNVATKSYQQKIENAIVTAHYSYPNPAETTSRFVVSFDSALGFTDGNGTLLSIYNFNGRKVYQKRGFTVDNQKIYLDWDLTNDLGYRVSNGTYHYRIVMPEKGHEEVRGKVTILR